MGTYVIRFLETVISVVAVAAIALCICISSSYGVAPYEAELADPLLEPWRWQVFPDLNGLGLRCLAEGSDGTVWFGIDEGVRSYDGVERLDFTPEDGLAGAPTNCLLAVDDGAVYAGSEMGISVYRGGRWELVKISSHTLRWFVNDLAASPTGELFAATSWGLLQIVRDKVTLYTSIKKKEALKILVPDVEVVTIPAEAIPLRRWSRSQSGSLGARIVEDTWRTRRLAYAPRVVWNVFPGGPAERAGLQTGDIIVAVDGQPDVGQERLVGQPGSRVRLTIERPGVEKRFDLESAREDLQGSFGEFAVHDVFIDSGGTIWLGLTDGEVLRSRIKDNAWRLFGTGDGLEIGGQPRIDQTLDGSVWEVCNSNTAGVNRFDGETWHSQRIGIGGDDDNTALLAVSDGSLLLSGIVDLSRHHDGIWTTHRHSLLAMPKTRVAQFMESADGDIWVAALGGEAYRLDYGSRRWQTYPGLYYQGESSDGVRWFLTEDDGVVANVGFTWTRYGIEDGLIDTSARLIVKRNDDVWVAGHHGGTAATARFDGSRWEKKLHPRLAHVIEKRAVFEDHDGSLWFGGAPSLHPEENHLGGVIRMSGDAVVHFTPPDVMRFAYGIGQTPDGSIWIGSHSGLMRYDGLSWQTVTDAPPFTTSFIDEIHTADNGDLWIGNRKYGVLRYDGKAWDRYPMEGDLAQGRVKNILATESGYVLASTPEGLNGFDGRTWTPHVMPPDLPTISQNGLKQARDGALWLISYDGGWASRGLSEAAYQRYSDYNLVSIRYQPDTEPPDTKITMSSAEIAQPGNTTVSWEGADRWDTTLQNRLQFAWRLDEGTWSVFDPSTNFTLLSLSAGDHTFEVKARDLDFNEDPTPAATTFTVVPPIWQQAWFLSFTISILVLVCFQAWRILGHRRNLLRANTGLARANADLQNEMVERKRVEQELVRLERLRALGELSAGVSHNLNNILTTVIGPAQLIRRSTEDPALQWESDLIIRSANRAADLVHRLHLSSRTEIDAKIEPVAVSKVVREAVQAARPRWWDEPQSRGVTISMVLEVGNRPPVKGTESGLHEILVNLFLNSVDAMPDGGVIKVRSRTDESHLELTVNDTGVGMDEETRCRVFEPFFTTKAAVGTGLGMSTAYAEVSRWGGTLEVVSAPDEGTTFVMRLPLWEEPLHEPPTLTSDRESRKANVLIVDDDADTRGLLGRLLGVDHHVTEVVDGDGALDGLTRDAFDVALVDLGLPGMPGDQVALQLRRIDANVALILITGWELDEDDPRTSAFDLRIGKPFRDLSEVEGIVAEGIEMCDKRRGGGPSSAAGAASEGRRSAVFVASRENLPVGAVGACLERRRERPRTDRVNVEAEDRRQTTEGRCR